MTRCFPALRRIDTTHLVNQKQIPTFTDGIEAYKWLLIPGNNTLNLELNEDQGAIFASLYNDNRCPNNKSKVHVS